MLHTVSWWLISIGFSDSKVLVIRSLTKSTMLVWLTVAFMIARDLILMQSSAEFNRLTTAWRSSGVRMSSIPVFLCFRYVNIILRQSRPRYARLGSLDLRNCTSKICLALTKRSSCSPILVVKTALTNSNSMLFGYNFSNICLNFAASLGSSLGSTFVISVKTLISFISSQLVMVLSIIVNRVGIVTMNSFGLIRVILRMVVTAEI